MNALSRQARIFAKPEYPAVLDKRQAREILGYTEDEFDAIIRSKHIQFLGTPRPRKQKKFATAHILELRDDVEWLSNAQDIISGHWRKLNASKRNKNKRTSLS